MMTDHLISNGENIFLLYK